MSGPWEGTPAFSKPKRTRSTSTRKLRHRHHLFQKALIKESAVTSSINRYCSNGGRPTGYLRAAQEGPTWRTSHHRSARATSARWPATTADMTRATTCHPWRPRRDQAPWRTSKTSAASTTPSTSTIKNRTPSNTTTYRAKTCLATIEIRCRRPKYQCATW